MTRKLFFAGAAALLLGACGESSPPTPPSDNPLLWEITNPDGEVEGWLYGTIHALPDGVPWRGEAVSEVIEAADFLVVEVANLDDRVAIAQAFQRSARSSGHPLLRDRVPLEDRSTLERIASDTPYSAEDYREIETWAAALILAQAIRTGSSSENGVDKALLREFTGRRITELEGAERQFAIFDQLAEEDQRVMLEAVLDEAQRSTPATKPAELWQSGDIAALEQETRKGFLADAEVRDALLVQRNLDWLRQSEELFADRSRPLIAVGAAHLVGEDGMVELLEARGYSLRRLR